MEQISFYDKPQRPAVKLSRKHPVWDQETNTIIGYQQSMMCEKCSWLLGTRFTYKEDIWYYDKCPNCEVE